MLKKITDALRNLHFVAMALLKLKRIANITQKYMTQKAPWFGTSNIMP